MDPGRFDALTRKFSHFLTRRQVFKGAGATAASRALAALPLTQESKCGVHRFCTDDPELPQDPACCCCGPRCDPHCKFIPVPKPCPTCAGVHCPLTKTCAAGETLCCCDDGDCCKDLNDPASCGSCFAAPCAGTCSGGVCTCREANKTYCPGVGCVDLNTDEAHCGACDAEPCLGRCIDGVCTCRGTKELCSTGCADLTADPRHCGRCEHACAATETCVEGVCCPGGHGMCWDQCIDLREDRNHCGACGHACASQQDCVDGICVRENPLTDGCTAKSLRLWISAFYPGVVEGFTRQRLLTLGDNERLETVSSPRPNELANPCSDTRVCLRTTRRPDPMAEQDWRAFFSRDPIAPSMAHGEVEIDLHDRRAIREVIPQPDATYGLLQHFADTTGGDIPASEEKCRRPMFGTSRWFHDFDPDVIENGIHFNVRATWDAWNPSECLDPESTTSTCPLDRLAVCPLGSIQGAMAVQVLPDEGKVRVTILELEVPRYPVIEIYAALDDGHIERVWASAEPPVPLADLAITPPEVISDLSIDLLCGCGPCDAGETACEDDETCISDAYFILSSSEELPFNQGGLGQAPGAGIDADGPITIFKNGLPEPIFSERDAGPGTQTPPIGFAGKKGDRLEIEIACPGGASSCPDAMAGPLFLHRIDSLFGERDTQVLIPGRVPLPLDDTHRRQVIRLGRVTKPGGICRPVGSGLTQICTDILSNPIRCGGLSDTGEFACGASEICLNGVCRCPIHKTRVGPRQCADLRNDDKHCGEPLNACQPGTRCVAGECRA